MRIRALVIAAGLAASLVPATAAQARQPTAAQPAANGAAYAAPVTQAGGPYRWASGEDAYYQRRLTVCADSLGVRHTRGGSPFGHLRKPQTFTVKGVDAEFGSEWVYGFAYGDVNAHGYVQNGWFCLTE